MTSWRRHGRTQYIGSRRTPGLIAVHHRPCSRPGGRDGPRIGGRELDRRCACEEAAEGRFHLQVRPLSPNHVLRRRFRTFGVPSHPTLPSPPPALAWVVVFADVARVTPGCHYRLDDMMSILFPHLYEDVEFLLPPEDVEMSDSLLAGSQDVDAGGASSTFATSTSRSNRRRVHENAVAGPSRLG
jgi:hypothetical protein